jgi:hypothetical protein
MAVEREAVHCWPLPNFAVEQTTGSHSLTRGCSPQRWADQ